MQWIDNLKQSRLIPVLEFSHLDQVNPVLDILTEFQFSTVEIALRHACAQAAIEQAIRKYPQLNIGIGSVISVDQLQIVKDLNAAFAVSPGFSNFLAETVHQLSIPWLPGVMTPSEIIQGMAAGFQHFKFFPAQAAGGANMLKSFSGPFKTAQFCPTGGIRLDNVADYLKCDNVFAAGASWFVSAKEIAEKNWQSIRQLTQQARVCIDEI